MTITCAGWLVSPLSSPSRPAQEPDILHAWQGLGYYSRARNLHRAAQRIVSEHDGKFPRAVREIRALPGIGEYTANAVATFAFERPVPLLEANTTRVLSRLFAFTNPSDTVEGRSALRSHAAGLLPRANACRYNSALMELGALICVPRRPKCDICPVQAWCLTEAPEALPTKRARMKTVLIEQERAFIRIQNNILLEQQTTARWRNLWCLPPRSGSGTKPCLVLKYTITHHAVTLSVFSEEPAPTLAPNQRWIPIDSLAEYPMPSPHRRALNSMLQK